MRQAFLLAVVKLMGGADWHELFHNQTTPGLLGAHKFFEAHKRQRVL